MSITISAPGKIHLLGEHAVVYGKPALLAAINKRLYIRIKNLELRIKNKDKENIKLKTPEGKKLILHSVNIFQKAFSIKDLPPLEISITSQIPIGCGLGSSAALSAATIGGLMKFVKNIWNPGKINELAYEAEKITHGNPSGADNTAVVFGGLIWYRREFDFLKSIWSLPISSYKIPQFVLINTGKPKETTKEMVTGVANLYAKKRKLMEKIFNDQERQTKSLLLALREGNCERLIEAIKKGERNLEKMEVVGNLAKKIVREIEKLGGAAKVCGAGGKKQGSGMLLCYYENLKWIDGIGRKYSLPVFPVKLGCEGIKIESQN